MEAELQSQVAFHLTGKRRGPDLDPVGPLALRPALLARYRDLCELRYDFPVVLVEGVGPEDGVQALSGIFDRILGEIARGDDRLRVSRHVLRLEREMRKWVAEGARGTLSELWPGAVERSGMRGDKLIDESLARARRALKVDGALVDCDAGLPARLVTHAWRAGEEARSARFRAITARLIQKLGDILRADFIRSNAGRSAESLAAGFGSLHADLFDFPAMSRLLAAAVPEASLPESRRDRIQSLLSTLESQRFHSIPGAPGHVTPPHAFAFASCTEALAAWRLRLPRMTAVAKAIAMAELEIAGEYREATHDAIFESFGDDGLDPKDLSLFPGYLVCMNLRELGAGDYATLMEILSAGLPFKVLVQTDDLLAASPTAPQEAGFATRTQPIANMAMGFNDVFVMQACSANLLRMRERLHAGLSFSGPTLFSIYSGATAMTEGIAPYLASAAAMESRVFPAFCLDPSAGSDWASRFDVSANPAPDADWPVRPFSYEDESHRSAAEDVTFTAIDFFACDSRYARHLARIPRSRWTANMVPAAQCLSRESSRNPDEVPYLLMVDHHNALHRVIVDERLIREARRYGEAWHSLQEQGGIHNSHALRLLARENKAREERERTEAKSTERAPPAVAVPSVAAPAASATPAASVTAVADVAQPERSADEAYIETPRCTSCNECTGINDKMFRYDENKQASIADVAAGSYAQLVEAAESCQVSIIHPGKPRNPNEPGLAELIRRAEPFQ